MMVSKKATVTFINYTSSQRITLKCYAAKWKIDYYRNKRKCSYFILL